MKIAERLRELIEGAKARGTTKLSIARDMGFSPQQLSNLLRGRNEWRSSQIEKLCEILDVSLAEAFLEKGEDAGLFILLKKIMDEGGEAYRAISWIFQSIAKPVQTEPAKVAVKRKRKKNRPKRAVA